MTIMLPNITTDTHPPFDQLDEYTFQGLCRDLLAEERGVESCEVYGNRGQLQRGIDILARRADGLVEVGQCKRYRNYTSRDLKFASEEFLKHWAHWKSRRVSRFILFVSCELSSSSVQEQIFKEVDRFNKLGVRYEAWSAIQIARRLRYHPPIVVRYCRPADHWLKVLCYPRGNIRDDYAFLAFSEFDKAIIESARYPDVLTPGVDASLFIKAFGSVIGDYLASQLYTDLVSAIVAVETGDFDIYATVAKSLTEHGAGLRFVESAAVYFSAEGSRLQADVSTDSNLAALLYAEAMDKYREALELFPNSPRALRGLAATLAKYEDYGEASRLLGLAEGIVLTGLSQRSSTPYSLDLIHERLRVSRHKTDLMLAIREASPLSVWNRENRRTELVGYAAQSQNLHEEFLPFFSSQKQWWRFESFAASMFLAKAWIALGNTQEWRRNLLTGLQRRAAMLQRRPLSAIERNNLRWWCQLASRDILSGAAPADDTFRTVREGAEDLEVALASGDGTVIINSIERILAKTSHGNFDDLS